MLGHSILVENIIMRNVADILIIRSIGQRVKIIRIIFL